MDSGKNITLEQLRTFAERADQRLDDLEKGSGAKASFVTISIPVSAWIENTDTTTVAAGFAVCADAVVDGLTEANSTDMVLDFASLEPAKICGMANISTPMQDAIRIYAMEVPTTALTATVRIYQGTTQLGG